MKAETSLGFRRIEGEMWEGEGGVGQALIFESDEQSSISRTHMKVKGTELTPTSSSLACPHVLSHTHYF